MLERRSLICRHLFVLFRVYGMPYSWKDYGLLALRLSLGWVFLWSGADKLYSEITTGQLATTGYLEFAVRGPFAEAFNSLAGNVLVDAFLVWGELLVGLSLILGLFVKLGSIGGAILMLSIYLSAFPPEHNPLVDEHIVYIVAFAILALFKAGRVLGLDQVVSKTKLKILA